eukprot:s1350_g22.t2
MLVSGKWGKWKVSRSCGQSRRILRGRQISPRERISPTHSLDSGDANGGKLSPHRKKDPKDPPQFAPGTPTMRSAQQEQPSQPSFPCISPGPRPKAIPVTGAQRPLRDRTPTPFAKEIVACDDGNGVQFNDPVTTEVLPAPEYPDFAPGTPPTPHGAKPWILKMDPEGICGTSPSAIVPYNTEPEGSWRLQPGGGWRLQSAASNEASDRSTKTLEDLRSARAAQSAGPAAPVRVPEVYDMAEGEDIIARINFLEGQAEEQRINNEALQVEVNELRAMLMELMQSPQSHTNTYIRAACDAFGPSTDGVRTSCAFHASAIVCDCEADLNAFGRESAQNPRNV